MRKTNTVEKEVDAIRDRLYEKTHAMTAAQRIAYFHDLANQAKSEYGVWQREGGKLEGGVKPCAPYSPLR